jgi:hypothetical protein
MFDAYNIVINTQCEEKQRVYGTWTKFQNTYCQQHIRLYTLEFVTTILKANIEMQVYSVTCC